MLDFNPHPKGGIKGALLPGQLHLWKYDKSAGRYVVEPASGRPHPRAEPVPATVHAHKFTRVTVSFDSGIR